MSHFTESFHCYSIQNLPERADGKSADKVGLLADRRDHAAPQLVPLLNPLPQRQPPRENVVEVKENHLSDIYVCSSTACTST